MTQISCNCGAVYEVLKTKGPARVAENFKCVVCGQEMLSWAGSEVAQFRLIKKLEPDRE